MVPTPLNFSLVPLGVCFSLARIYTRTGDRGETGLVGGARVPKDSVRVEAYGSVDELNSVLGIARTFLNDKKLDALLAELQMDLFVVGADLASLAGHQQREVPRITKERVAELEGTIDKFEGELSPLKAFILPGGGVGGSILHNARTVARRAERRIVTLSKAEEVNDQMIPYMNRLSDLLFVMARMANHRENKGDVEWHPNNSLKSSAPHASSKNGSEG
jgi:cob(I)alamin adenosyltransferase